MIDLDTLPPEAAAELRHLRDQRDRLQTRCNALLFENRSLRGMPVQILAKRAALGAPLPAKKHAEDSGYDIGAWWGDSPTRAPRLVSHSHSPDEQRRAAAEESIDGDPPGIRLWSGASLATPIGWHLCAPAGWEIQVRPRSGLGINLAVVALFGTVDGCYIGETWVLITNHSRAPFVVRRGERIAQAVVAPVTASEMVQVDELPTTPRGTNGLGSSGR